MPVQANNIYVGARYIPRIMGEYNNETAYEALDSEIKLIKFRKG